MTPAQYSAQAAAQHRADPNRHESRLARILGGRYGWVPEQIDAARRALDAAPSCGPQGEAVDVLAIACAAAGETRRLDGDGYVV